MNETVGTARIDLTVDVIPCKDGGFVGSIQEIPIVVQADTRLDLGNKISECLLACVAHYQPETAKRPIIQVTV